MKVERFDDIWDAIEDDPAVAANLRIRSALMDELTRWIRASGLTQTQVAQKFGVTQPRVSDLVRGHIDLFSIDALVNMLGAAGMRLELQVRPR